MERQVIGAKEVSQILGVSEGKSYGIIRELNAELKSRGYITVAGKVPKKFFFEKCYCDENEAVKERNIHE